MGGGGGCNVHSLEATVVGEGDCFTGTVSRHVTKAPIKRG